ncbi:hypothetical protein [Brevundimonas lutea]|uniref:hypothetical protein n=1 Tax=Brevundimonas lutea TaxID=2293980 RepID=UPI000F033829|nr:hypothetical protein [Brevundimonas lutea]
MRRFTLWTILLLTLGAILAGAGYWAYWNAYARFQPVTVAENAAEIEALLNRAVWLSDVGGDRPVWFVGYRDGGMADRYQTEELPKLKAAGLEPRVILFARPDAEGQTQSTAAERSTIAALWLTRDQGLYRRWMETPVANWTAQGVPPADGDLARDAVVEASRDFAEELRALLEPSDLPEGWPLVIWRDEQGFMKACACASRRSWPFVRDDVGAPDQAAAPTPAPLPTDVAPPVDPSSPLPYPEVSPLAPDQPAGIPQVQPPAPSATPAPKASSRSSQPRPQSPAAAEPAPTGPRPAPKAQTQDDATFF